MKIKTECVSRFSIIQRAIIAAAHCSAQANISSRIAFPKLEARFSDAASRSRKEVPEDSKRNSIGGRLGGRICDLTKTGGLTLAHKFREYQYYSGTVTNFVSRGGDHENKN
jgi:hypothetical protein